MEFSRQEYWSGLSFPSRGDLPDPRLQHCRPILYCLSHQRFLWQIPKSVVNERKKKKIRLFLPFKMQRLQKAGCEKQVFPLISALPPASSTHPVRPWPLPGQPAWGRHTKTQGMVALLLFVARVFLKHKLPYLIHFLTTRCHAPGGLSRPRTQWGQDSLGVISISLFKQIWKRNRVNILICLPWWKHETSSTIRLPARLRPRFPARLGQLWDLGPGTKTLSAVHRNQFFSCSCAC